MSQSEKQTVAPDTDQVLSTTVPSTLDRRQGQRVAVDGATGDLVVAENRSNTSTAAAVLTWFTPGQTGYTVGFSRAPDTGRALDVGVAKSRALLVLDDRVLLVDKQGATLATYKQTTGALSRLLSIDDDYVYVAGTFVDSGTHLANAAFALKANDLSLAGQYVLPEAVLSRTMVGDVRVFGMQSTLAVATPVCN